LVARGCYTKSMEYEIPAFTLTNMSGTRKDSYRSGGFCCFGGRVELPLPESTIVDEDGKELLSCSVTLKIAHDGTKGPRDAKVIGFRFRIDEGMFPKDTVLRCQLEWRQNGHQSGVTDLVGGVDSGLWRTEVDCFAWNCKVYQEKNSSQSEVVIKAAKYELVCTLDVFEWVTVNNDGAAAVVAKEVKAVTFPPLDRLEHENLCDVTLKARGEGSIRCHKTQLARMSRVFAAMFNHDLKENKTGTVEIDDFEMDTVQDFVEFVYTKKLENKAGYNTDLLEMANKYDVKELRIICGQELRRGLKDSNVIPLWIAAEACQAQALKLAAMEYLVKNWSKKEDFCGYQDVIKNHPNLVTELLTMKK